MTGPLVDVATLRTRLGGPMPPVVLDVRWSLTGPAGAETFAAGHIPGAVFVDLDTDLADPPGAGGRHPLPDPERFAAAMRRAGVSQERGVVVTDGGDGTVAARAWWLLRHHGHDDVTVLDGGFAAWVAAGGEVATGRSGAPYDDGGRPGERAFEARAGRLPVLQADQAAALARSGVLLDARAAGRYAGDVEPVDAVAGHIPGAVSAPTAASLGQDGRILPKEDLVRRLGELGIGAGSQVGAYCGSGVTAAHAVLVLEVAGIGAALYPGSWSEWITDPTRPIATGPDPG